MKLLGAFVLSCLIFSVNTYAQNLVPNAGFEQYSSCPNTGSQLNYTLGWSTFSQGTPDYYHTCGSNSYGSPQTYFGYQLPAEGNAFVGVFMYVPSVDWKEYIHCTLNTPMQPGCAYEVSMSVSLPNKAYYATDDLGVYFFKNGPVYFNTLNPIPVTPQVSYSSYGPITDTANWVRFNAVYVPDSAYDHIVIGGFKDSNTLNKVFVPTGVLYCGYYFIDSIMVRKLPVSLQFADTVLCQEDIITVPYTTLACAAFTGSNIFTLQLSDKNGSFANPVNIGSVTSAVSGNIQGVIPANTPTGYGYRLRIVTSSLLDSSLANEHNIRIGTPVKAGSNAPVCEGQTFQLMASGFLPGTTFSWSGPLSYTSTQQSPPVPNVTMGSAGKYIVTATLNGCPGEDTVNVMVMPVPVITSGSNSPVCEGADVHLTATSSIPGSSFNWQGPGGFNSSNQNTTIQKIIPQQAGQYIVKAIKDLCISKLDTIDVSVNAIPLPPAVNDTAVCLYTQNVQLHVAGDSVKWYESQTAVLGNFEQPTLNTSTAGKQTIYVTQTINGCESGKRALNISFLSVPEFDLGKDVTICNGGSAKIGVEKEDVSYSWNTGAAQCCLTVKDAGIYIEQLSNACGTATDSIMVNVQSCHDCIYFASAFTPNGDGLNDNWGGITACAFKKYTLKIYNRWGNLVFESHNPADRWDGQSNGYVARGDTYSYFVEYTPDIAGATYTALLKGNVILVR